ncbi:SDR family NAD(P)-dependent oxidoreductase [Paenibacillus humicola]|uniref:SDR family NAD(P)-dependent oxidoreductase n=1 Tax=Paenibacillus humicola TaxID=3110540 RepID=UPI00237A87B2|nr:SDR family oxidoreductase [Paenibacillus humicola]
MTDSESRTKNALVTGGSLGIGRGIALALAETGYNVAISHLNEPEEAAKVADTIRERYGRSCFVFQGDLTQEDTPARLARQAIDALGDVHVLVNNAGITIMSPLVDMDPARMDALYRLNYRAPLVLMQMIGRHMIERTIRGSIINTASTRGERAYPADSVYGGLKAALIRSVQSIALELAPYGIRVNCIAPGAIQVREARSEHYARLGERIPLGRAGTPADIGGAAVWLASDASSYVTGTTIRVDGGLILPGMPERTDTGSGASTGAGTAAGAAQGWGSPNK